MNIKKFSFIIVLISILLGIIVYIFKYDTTAISNVMFLVGLLLLVIGFIFILAKGHLFTGWRIFHRNGDNERFDNEKISAKEIGRKKNEAIVINDFAKSLLLIGITWVLISIGITL
ncbi:DUF3899 domain-containing protein [Apilactobacillus apisilvae]|uniref:DUF3899 domain-containing protein n=1 Tax=Apilactobacillus apisilvae TaxID=2923364 RepID=A0ABY4PHT8_9LACO|nr:DUF3899 domain-containing protein [Apilactobacillus apisilvae]UQS84991.1 DUF3899 domain-containing protein [Apilactobacillus apisilvae]